jgi:hexosaminidase
MKFCFFLFFAIVAGIGRAESFFPTVLPTPVELLPAPKTNLIEVAAVSIVVDSSGQPGKYAAEFLAGAFQRAGMPVAAKGFKGRATTIRFVGGDASRGDEGYVLSVDERGVKIAATGGAGHFYAAQTLLQLFTPDLLAAKKSVTHATLPIVTIKDQPRFRWRGAMIDLSRHFFGPDYLKRFIDLLAMNKMNVLHLHLTDDNGWRLESGAFPKLNTIGATGNHSDSNAPPALLTTNDVRDLIAYAQKRFITIVPEIDMPGHAAAATRAYPEFDGGNNTFNPNPYGPTNAYVFVTNILAEVIRLFPSQVIHFGGDEVDHKGWASIEGARRLMNERNMSSPKELEHYFDRAVADFIAKAKRKPAGWDEIAGAGVTNTSVIFWWRHDRTKVRDDALAAGLQMVMCPRSPCYFDYRQVPGGIGASGWKITNTVENVYNWEPVPAGIAKYSGQILGVQANLWTEHIDTVEKLERLTLPRLAALAEIAWSPQNARDWPVFAGRLHDYQARVSALGYATEDVDLPPRSSDAK